MSRCADSARSSAVGSRLPLNSASTLPNLDEIAVAHIAPNLRPMVLGIGEELRALAAPFPVARLHVTRHANIHEAGCFVRVCWWMKRDHRPLSRPLRVDVTLGAHPT